ncbi:GNAT family N-acetyltransferase [Thalassospira mesophila]|uniref:N-acetyltransferase domain-containing protein n=1 Tax=Thalassospira mesophila TaxID=1293891 RepID=A0A1Y2KWZ8_9PROT|nr:GNAT family N-acetyltransferase [Thalassospira mesophila]OSQ36745.1 hypothetical protein TMES_16850 [Thalassospira mesophila]
MTDIIRLGQGHLGAVIDLHHKVLSLLPAGLAAQETDRFFADHISDCGQIYGAFNGENLIAYSILGLPRAGDPNFGTDHQLPSDQLADVAHIDGVAVAPAWRGQGWHRKMIDHRLATAQVHGRKIMLSTVAPGNLPSLRSLMSCGFTICGIIEKFGGIRYLMRQDVSAGTNSPPVLAAQETLTTIDWVNIDDLARQRAFFARGAIGVSWNIENDQVQIGFIAS